MTEQSKSPKNRVLLRPEQAAEYLGLVSGTLENWRGRRQGPDWIKVGGAVRYDLDALNQWLDAQTRTEIPPASGM